MRSGTLTIGLTLLFSLSTLAKEAGITIKTSDIKIEYAFLAPCIELSIEKVKYISKNMATVTFKQVLKKPIQQCLKPLDDFHFTSVVTALVTDSAKNELFFHAFFNGNFPKEVGGINRAEIFLTSIPENVKPPITIVVKEKL